VILIDMQVREVEAMPYDTNPNGIHVGPSGDPARPVAVQLGHTSEPADLSRDDAWRLWHRLQAELVRTLPYPTSYPRSAGS
jgi:hypothetical protein